MYLSSHSVFITVGPLGVHPECAVRVCAHMCGHACLQRVMKTWVDFAAFDCVVPGITPGRYRFLGRMFGDESVHSYLRSEAVTSACN